jgi:4-hydroxybenzoate polyprenyltransferase
MSGPAFDSIPSSSVPPPAPERTLVNVALGLVRTARPHQLVKNVFVLAPVVFAKEIFAPELMVRAGGAFVVFSLVTGAVYTLNDIVDAEADRVHPVKRSRPIASGLISPTVAKVFLASMIALALAGAAIGPLSFLLTVGTYFVMNVAYSFRLKQVPYIDVGIIALGFVLRVMAGGFGTQIHVSAYLFVCTALLALFLGFGKRRHEFAAAELSKKKKQRAVLAAYSKRGLDISLGATALATISVYAAYTLDPHTREYFRSENLWLTTGFVVLAVLRFLFLVSKRPDSESPTQEMLKDGPFVGIVMGWAAVMLWIVYNLRPGS